MGSSESYGKQWQAGDVIGVLLDLIDRTISKLSVSLFLYQLFLCQTF